MSVTVTDRSLPAKANLLAFTTSIFLQVPNFQAQNTANIAKPSLAFHSISRQSLQAGITAGALVAVDVLRQSPIASQRYSEFEKTKQDALDNLYETFTKCRGPGWDGYDGLAMSYDSYLQAKRLIGLLPAYYPAPEIAADPDGEISFEWYREPGRVFSVSIGSNAELTYAGKFSPSEKTHGTVPFADQLPLVILDNIRRLLA